MERGLEVDKYFAQFGVEVESGLVGIYTAKQEEPGAMQVRRSADKQNITVYLNNVFDSFPQLRPAGVRQCVLTRVADAKGIPCAMLQLNSALLKRRGKRDSAQSAAGQMEGKSQPAGAGK